MKKKSEPILKIFFKGTILIPNIVFASSIDFVQNRIIFDNVFYN